jgi:predicted dehydrogenase
VALNCVQTELQIKPAFGQSNRRNEALPVTGFTPPERDYIRRSLDMFFSTLPTTVERFAVLRKAIEAGKHIYAEKPIACSTDDAFALVRMADATGVKHGTVQDKLFLPGFENLLMVSRSGFFGRILEVRVDMGRWVFDGTLREGQRPNWNYQKSGGGGLVLDMFPHWRYMLGALVGPIGAISCNSLDRTPQVPIASPVASQNNHCRRRPRHLM